LGNEISKTEEREKDNGCGQPRFDTVQHKDPLGIVPNPAAAIYVSVFGSNTV
jgi:hypothetical protein